MLRGEAPNRRRKDNDYRSCTLLRGSNVPLHDEAGEFSYYRQLCDQIEVALTTDAIPAELVRLGAPYLRQGGDGP